MDLLLGRPAVCQGADGHASAETKTTRITVVKHLAILELQQFRMMQLPIIIIDDILHANLQVSVWLQMARHEMPPAISRLFPN